jgi:phage baseplate assembly protein W
MTTYKGFSSHLPSNKAYDVEIAKQDLLNTFMTRKGERVMAPDIGTGIWDVLFDALTPELESYVKKECLAIVSQDIRFELIGVNIIPVPNGFTLVIRLNYLPDNLVTDLQVNFDASKEIK